jgi:DNA mismatch repair protein MutS
VQASLQSTIARIRNRKLLANVLDLERLLAKLTLGTAGPRELLALGRSLALVPKLKEQRVSSMPARLRAICEALDEIPEVRDRILDRDRRGASGESGRRRNHSRRLPHRLDELRDISRNSRQYIAQIETAGARPHGHPVA